MLTVKFGEVIPWSETAAGTNGGATASHAAVTGYTHWVTHVSGHTDADSTVQILAGAAGATVVAETAIDISLEGFQIHPMNGHWEGAAGIKVEAKIAASAADCQINMCGFSVRSGA